MIRVGMDDVGETLVHKNVWVGWILYVHTQIGQPSNMFVWINHCDTVKLRGITMLHQRKVGRCLKES